MRPLDGIKLPHLCMQTIYFTIAEITSINNFLYHAIVERKKWVFLLKRDQWEKFWSAIEKLHSLLLHVNEPM